MIVTPVNAERFKELLVQFQYDPVETQFIFNGFKNGFDLGYRGPTENIQRVAPNLKFRIGNPTMLWNRVMKEVKLKRYAGPFQKPPFQNFIQSPIGLVPKDSGKDVRLIFHLSFPRDGQSVNSETPVEFCSVKYPDFADAIRLCMDEVNSHGTCFCLKK